MPLVCAITGITAAWYAYRRNPGLPGRFVSQIHTVYTLVFRKYYFDEIYNFLFVRPAQWAGCRAVAGWRWLHY